MTKLKIGKWYRFDVMKAAKNTHYNPKVKEESYKGKVLAAYRNFYLVETRTGRKTTVSINELVSNVKAVAV